MIKTIVALPIGIVMVTNLHIAQARRFTIVGSEKEGALEGKFAELFR